MIHNNLPNSPMMTLSHPQPLPEQQHDTQNKQQTKKLERSRVLWFLIRLVCPPCKHDGQTALHVM